MRPIMLAGLTNRSVFPFRRLNSVFLAIGLLALGHCSAWPQLPVPVFDATTLRQPTTLGSTWLVHGGDDPAYARSNYDDSRWMRFDPHTDLRNLFESSRPELVWYRQHVKVAPDQSGLGLQEWALSDAYEIYINGERVLRAGSIKPYSGSTAGARLTVPIPEHAVKSGELVIALRVPITRYEWTVGTPGLYYENLWLGQESALRQQAWLTVIGANAATWLFQIASLGLGIVALALFNAQRDRKEYLWIFLLFLVQACHLAILVYQYFHSIPTYWALIRATLSIAGTVFSTLMFLAFLKVRAGTWVRAFLVLSAAGSMLAAAVRVQGAPRTRSRFSRSSPANC